MADYAGFGGELWQAHPAIFVEQVMNINRFMQYTAQGKHKYNMVWLARRRLCVYAKCFEVDQKLNSVEMIEAIREAIRGKRKQMADIGRMRHTAMTVMAAADCPDMLMGILSRPGAPNDQDIEMSEAIINAAANEAVASLKYLLFESNDRSPQMIALREASLGGHVSCVKSLINSANAVLRYDELSSVATNLMRCLDTAKRRAENRNIRLCAGVICEVRASRSGAKSL